MESVRKRSCVVNCGGLINSNVWNDIGATSRATPPPRISRYDRPFTDHGPEPADIMMSIITLALKFQEKCNIRA
jgi:hypothetical protein